MVPEMILLFFWTSISYCSLSYLPIEVNKEHMKVQYGHGYLATLRIDTGFLNGLLLVAEWPRWRGGMG